MNVNDFSKYVGIPFAFNESSFEAADCAGLASLFYREHGWTSQSDYPKPKHKDWYITDQLYMQRWLVKNFDMSRDIEDIEFGIVDQMENLVILAEEDIIKGELIGLFFRIK